MTNPLARFSETAYVFLRFFAGAMFCCHGIQKLTSFFPTPMMPHAPEMWSQMWIGGVLELVCGVAVALGLFTWLFAFVASGQMAVAYFQFHAHWSADDKFFPIQNGGEMAVLYCFVFLFIACKGGGSCSIDGARRRTP